MPAQGKRRKVPAMSEPRVVADRILIVLLGAIGDVTRALPLLTRLRLAYPEAEIAWAVEPACRTFGHATLSLATCASRGSLPLACTLYVVAQRSFSAAGFCRARRTAARPRIGAPWRRWAGRVSAFLGSIGN